MCDQECWCPGSITTHQPLDCMRPRCCKNTEIRAKGGKQKSGLVSECDLVCILKNFGFTTLFASFHGRLNIS